MVLEKTLESPLDCKEIKPVNPKGNQAWIFIGRTDAEAQAPILWPPDVKRPLIGKDPDAGKVKGKRRSRWQRRKWLDGITNLTDMNLSKRLKIVEDRGDWCATVYGVVKSWTRLGDRMTITLFRGHYSAYHWAVVTELANLWDCVSWREASRRAPRFLGWATTQCCPQ